MIGFDMGQVVAAGIGAFGQHHTNRSNIKMASDASDRNSWEAARQMQFQERMANTSHAREVADLKAAGLNPILSANAGAATPGGAAGSAVSAEVKNELENVAASAREMALAKQQLRKGDEEIGLLKSTQKKTDQDTAKARAETVRSHMETKLLEKALPGAEVKSDVYKTIQQIFQGGASDAPWRRIKDLMDTNAKKLKGKP